MHRARAHASLARPDSRRRDVGFTSRSVNYLRRGIVATQATLSRDLEELGAVKVRVAGGDTVYAIPELPKDRLVPEEQLRRVLADWVVDEALSQQ